MSFYGSVSNAGKTTLTFDKVYPNRQAMETYCKEGKVLQAQSECLDIGVYGTNYDSYPWSLGMAMRVLHFDR